jgi:predicted nucleic acid-binding protein
MAMLRADMAVVRIRDFRRFERSHVFGRRPHPHKADAQRLLEKLISDRHRLVTGAEVLQEILHRYVAINRREAIQPAFDALLGIADQVLPVDAAAAGCAKEIVMGHRQISARDALHLAIMEHHGIERILSFDAGFDGFPGVERLS